MLGTQPPFWQTKTLTEMTRDEWESICDHCGKCCLIKLQDDSDTQNEDAHDSVYYTNVICDLFDQSNGYCSDYWNRETRVPSCLRLTQDNLEALEWMPPSCAYRRLMEGQGLPNWHHLVSGDKQRIHQSGHSVLGRVYYESEVDDSQLEEHIVTWPLK